MGTALLINAFSNIILLLSFSRGYRIPRYIDTFWSYANLVLRPRFTHDRAERPPLKWERDK